VDAVRGDGRTGRVGFVSMLKERIRDNESGIGAPFPRKGELPPLLPRRMLVVCGVVGLACPACLSYVFYGLSAVVPLGLPDGRPGQVCERKV
jgi:hypothetical protein